MCDYDGSGGGPDRKAETKLNKGYRMSTKDSKKQQVGRDATRKETKRYWEGL